mmetsp:Transcript_18608/g.22802  ORF Transcript_18608/g.22802 Transcript_18608/m.22802 type:complete len:173 (-) Transcript_18608:377-895(-)
MKTSIAITAACIASASAFAPANTNARQSTQLAEKKSLFKTISDMDLFAPVKDQNDYGARGKKNVKVGELTSRSYIPNGLTKEQYDAVRKNEKAKKDANYQRNVSKAGKFLDYTQFYIDRGTDTGEDWQKSVTLGHRMAKTKYDWSGRKDENKSLDSAVKKTAPKKKGIFGRK